MKKWTGILLSLIIALIFIAYYVMGFIVESTLNKNINAIPHNAMFKVLLDKYQRGWFSSKATLVLKMHIPESTTTDKKGTSKTEPTMDFEMDFPLTINHGPIIFTDFGIRFGMGQATTSPQTHYNVLINYFNETLFSYTAPSLASQGKIGNEDFQFEWLGLRTQIKVSPNLDKLDGNFILYGISGKADNAAVKLGEVTNSFYLTHHQDGLWLGQTHLSVPVVTVTEGAKKLFDLEAFDFSSGSNITEGLLNFDCNASLQKFYAEDTNYGPGSLKLSIKNIDPAVMANINQSGLTMLQNNQDPNLFMLGLVPELPKLLSKGAELDLSELIFNFPEGKFTGNLKISSPKNEVNNPDEILKKVHGDGQFKAPIAVVKKFMVSSIEEDLNKAAQSHPTTQESTTTPLTTSTTTPPATASTTIPPRTAITATPPATTSTATPITTDFNAEAQKQADKLLQDYVSKGLIKVEGNYYVVNFKLENEQFIVNGKPFNSNMLH